MTETTQIASRAARVREQVADACAAAGRSPESVEIMAVTKGHSLAAVEALYAAGFRCFGENRVQEARAKYGEPGARPAWIENISLHLIGHLQSNKVKLARDYFQLIQSVDREPLAERLNGEENSPRRIMVEVNAGGEPQKHGLLLQAVDGFVASLRQYAGLVTVGLMVMLPQVDPPQLELLMEEARSTWEHVRQHQWPWAPCQTLSMGMSRDFALAIRHGSNQIRIGTALLGPRDELAGRGAPEGGGRA